ncbi:MAG: galactose oxidase early set domain-containing protein [Planctomycetes bacterium]|nr:galactose oxidase early set domain-containing protein [Planctomycetota bacterium]
MRPSTIVVLAVGTLLASACENRSNPPPPVVTPPAPVGWTGPYFLPVHTPGACTHCSEIAHAILLAKPGPNQGKVLMLQTDGRRWLWDPADPSMPMMEDGHGENLESLFCAGHSADVDGNILIVAGNRTVGFPPGTCGSQPTWSHLFDPTTLTYSPNYPLLVPAPTPPNLGYWYPSTVRLPDGRVLAAGGGSAPLIPGAPCFDPPGYYFVDGWQIFDATFGGWFGSGPNQWFDGLPTGANGYEYQFTYYPLLFTIPASPPAAAANPQGYLFAGVAPDFAGSTTSLLTRSGTAIMDLSVAGWPWTGQWSIHPSQISQPGGEPRNLIYPSGVIRPLLLGEDGLPSGPVEVMILGGADYNLPRANPPPPGPGQDGGGAPAVHEVWQIAAPEQPGSQWNSNGTRFPNLNFPRVYANTVQMPDGQMMVIGGSTHDYFPNAGGAPGAPGGQFERVAEPVMVPEFLDLLAPNPQWRLGAPHLSPRLYHSVALLLPDGSILVGGGYRGIQPPGLPTLPVHFTWANHVQTDLEVWNPEYMSAGPRPTIEAVSGEPGIGFGTTFTIDVALAGANAPNAAIESVVLITPGSVTHHFSWDQRMVSMSFTATAGSRRRLTVRAPANGSVAPPGWYMLFVVTNGATSSGTKIPSVAKFVQLR